MTLQQQAMSRKPDENGGEAKKAEERVQLSLRGTNLKTSATFKQNVPSAFAEVSLLGSNPKGDVIEHLGKTEVVPYSSDPEWCKVFILPYTPQKATYISVTLKYEKESGKIKPLGTVTIEINETFNARGRTVVRRFGEDSSLVARVEKAGPFVGALTLALQGQKLRNMELRGQSDPFFVMAALTADGGSETVYRSKHVENNLNPQWEPFVIDLDRLCGGDMKRKVRISVFDFETNGKHRRMGDFSASVDELINARIGGDKTRGFTLIKKERDYGTIFVSNAKVDRNESGHIKPLSVEEKAKKDSDDDVGEFLFLTMHGSGLKNMEMLTTGTSDPFFEMYRHAPGANDKGWLLCFRSNHIDSDLNPKWPEVNVKSAKLCDGNRDKPIKISVFDHESNGYHKKIGSVESTVNQLLMSISTDHLDPNSGLQIKKGGRKTGKLIIVDAYVKTKEKEPPPPPKESETAVKDDKKKKNEKTASGRSLSRIPSNGTINTLSSTTSSVRRKRLIAKKKAKVKPTFPRPTFDEYIENGCELQLCFAIDFNECNGDPRSPESRHYLNPDDSPNEYELAIRTVGTILSKYDLDCEFPVWGFGARFCGKLQNCFQIGPDPELDGIDSVIDSYKDCVRWGFTLGRTAILTEVVNEAVKYATRTEEEARKIGDHCYTVLLILTGGTVDFVDCHADSIAAASHSPLSIVVVGIGESDFEDMQYLDEFAEDDHTGQIRDITKFVPFRQFFDNGGEGLEEAVMAQVPDQLVDWMYSENIKPDE